VDGRRLQSIGAQNILEIEHRASNGQVPTLQPFLETVEVGGRCYLVISDVMLRNAQIIFILSKKISYEIL
jgi:hypothetical protein